MKKLISVLLVVLMLGALCVCVFADKDPVYSPTAPREWLVEYVDYGNGIPPIITNEIIPEGEVVRIESNPNSPYEFEGFEIQGEYEIVEGSLTGPYIVIRPLSDLVINEKYKGVIDTTSPSDTSPSGPPTGFSPLWITVAFIVLAVCAVAAVFVIKRFAKKEN